MASKTAELTMESAAIDDPDILEAFEEEDIDPSEVFAQQMQPKIKSIRAKPELIQTAVNFGLVDISKIDNEGYEAIIRTDTGLNEGFVLREYLLSAYYDERTGPDEQMINTKSIDREMRQEVGIAKIDADKRADEILLWY